MPCIRASISRFLTPQSSTQNPSAGLTAWALFSWMQPLFAAAKRKAKANDDGNPALDPEQDIYPFPFEWRAAEASERLLALRRRYPRDSLWASVFRLGAWGQMNG